MKVSSILFYLYYFSVWFFIYSVLDDYDELLISKNKSKEQELSP